RDFQSIRLPQEKACKDGCPGRRSTPLAAAGLTTTRPASPPAAVTRAPGPFPGPPTSNPGRWGSRVGGQDAPALFSLEFSFPRGPAPDRSRVLRTPAPHAFPSHLALRNGTVNGTLFLPLDPRRRGA